jgi:hypothetical protein
MINKVKEVKSNFGKIYHTYWILLALFILLVGILAAIFVAQYVKTQERELLLTRAKTIAAGISDDMILPLSGTIADVSLHEYEDLKRQMMDIQAANPDAHFVYLMGFRDGELFFYADSEPEDSEDISLSGDIYDDASDFKVKNAYEGRAFIEGPYKDQWGTWVSAYAPIVDHQTDRVIAVAGIDVDAKALQQKIWYMASLSLIVNHPFSFIPGSETSSKTRTRTWPEW